MSRDLLQLRNSDSILNLDIGMSMSDFDEAMRNPKNPLKQGLPLSSKNIFIDILKFALEHNKDLIYTILCHTTPGDCDFGEEVVIGTAMIYMYMSSRMNNRNTAFLKLQGILLQSCGLNETGLQAMSKLGECSSVRTLLDTRTDLAIKDETRVKAMAKKYHIAIVLDNVDRLLKHVVQHQTLPMLLCRDVPGDFYEKDRTRKTLEEAKEYYTGDFFYLDSPRNEQEKESFMLVIMSKIIFIKRP